MPKQFAYVTNSCQCNKANGQNNQQAEGLQRLSTAPDKAPETTTNKDGEGAADAPLKRLSTLTGEAV